MITLMFQCQHTMCVFLSSREVGPASHRAHPLLRHTPQTINLLRAFSSGGFADINKLNAWNMDFVQNTPEGSKYREMASKIEDTLRFMTVRLA